MTLLRSGSQKVCVASDVEQSLRDLIVPKVTSINADLPVQDKNAAISSFNVAFTLTTLSSFDKGVAKAACNTSVVVTGPDGTASSPYQIDYAVSPAANDESTFIISAAVSPIKAYLGTAIASVISEAIAKKNDEATASADAANERALLAHVNERWLVGRWINATDSKSACVDGDYDEYKANHEYGGYESSGSWQLQGLNLKVVFESQGEKSSATTKITAADGKSFTEVGEDGTDLNRVRCMRADMVTPPATGEDQTERSEPATTTEN